ncbi:MAG: ATP-dependent helicase, partial [Ilumatobacteraceae bacterium]
MTENQGRRDGRRRGRGGRSRGQGAGSAKGDNHHDDEQRSGNLTSTTALPPVETPTGFAALGVPERIDAGLAACGFGAPFAIQVEAIPVAMQGRDVCGRAKTGSG